MEDLIPPLLTMIHELQWQLKAGRGVRESLQNYLRTSRDELGLKFAEIWSLHQTGAPQNARQRLHTDYQRALWELLQRGMLGQPILEPLNGLALEVEFAAQEQMNAHLATLPFKVLLPLLLFQFPGFLLLLAVPLLRELQQGLGG